MRRPRIIVPVLLLTASIGAAGSAVAEPTRRPPAPTALVPTARPAAPPKPLAEQEVPPGLYKLRDSLALVKPDRLLAEVPRFRALCDADGYPLVGNLATKNRRIQPSELCTVVRSERAGTAASASPTPPPTPTPDPRPRPNSEPTPAQFALLQRLFDTPEYLARAQLSRFRPLCDAQGYPLVGNLASKGDGMSVDAFCEIVRSRMRSRVGIVERAPRRSRPR